MNKVSFIVSIDNSFELVNNFFENFLCDAFVRKSEIIVVIDAVYNAKLLNYLNDLKQYYNNITLISLEAKAGYGKANNIGVLKSSGEYIFFINTDVFANNECFIKMLSVLTSSKADCVQPLLLYPQNNRIQCAGTIFGPYYKNHLFSGRKLESIDLSTIPPERQALTSALYAMKKETFLKYGKFDEFYFNKIESMELSLKLSLNHKKCVCISDAIAYHAQGTSRNNYYFDFNQQEAHFWCNIGRKVKIDICKYYRLQLNDKMKDSIYHIIAITQVRDVLSIIKEIPIEYCSYIEINGINPNKINLYDLLPYSIQKLDIPILFYVENIATLSNNQKWFEDREQEDIILDTFGNLIYTSEV